MSKPLLFPLFPIILLLSYPQLSECRLIIKDLLEIPKGTIYIYAYANVNQTFTLRLKSNHSPGNEWHLVNPNQIKDHYINPLNLNETTNSVPMHKLDNYPQLIIDDVYYDFQFQVTDYIHQDITVEITFRATQFSSTLKTYTDVRTLVLYVRSEPNETYKSRRRSII